jgi:hypothetical protein
MPVKRLRLGLWPLLERPLLLMEGASVLTGRVPWWPCRGGLCDVHRLGEEVSGGGLSALGGAVDALASDHGGRSGNGDLLAVQVHCRPLEVQQFAAPSTGIAADVEEREQPMLPRGVEGRPELGDGPDGPRFAGLLTWPFGPLDGVAGTADLPLLRLRIERLARYLSPSSPRRPSGSSGVLGSLDQGDGRGSSARKNATDR